MEIFNNGDKEYFKWMTENPNGYILNTGMGKRTSAFILHKSNCSHISYENKRKLIAKTSMFKSIFQIYQN